MEKEVLDARLHSWIPVIRQASQSGMSHKEWCIQNGIPIRKYYYWQKAVRQYILEHPDLDLTGQNRRTSAALPQPVQQSEPAVPAFFEVNLDADQKASEVPAQDSGSSFSPEIVMEYEGIRLLIGKTVSEGTLSTVLSVIRHA